MALSKERLGEIALRALQENMEQEGIRLRPKEIRREVHNEAKRLMITEREAAELITTIIEAAYQKTMAELQRFIHVPDERSKDPL